MMERTDADGRWTSEDGVAWVLVEPSAAWLAEQEATALAEAERIAKAPPSREESTALAARLSVVDKVRADELDDDTVSQLVALFPPLADGLAVKAREVYAWDGTLVEVIQPHTTQADWTPDVVPALFSLEPPKNLAEFGVGSNGNAS